MARGSRLDYSNWGYAVRGSPLSATQAALGVHAKLREREEGESTVSMSRMSRRGPLAMLTLPKAVGLARDGSCYSARVHCSMLWSAHMAGMAFNKERGLVLELAGGFLRCSRVLGASGDMQDKEKGEKDAAVPLLIRG